MKMTARTFLIAFILLPVTLLWTISSSCSKSSTAPETSPVAAAVDGLWAGGFIFKEQGKAVGNLPAFALIAPDGRAFFTILSFEMGGYHLAAYGKLYSGKVEISGSLSIYDSTGTAAGVLSIAKGKTVESTANGKKFYNFVAEFRGTAAPLEGRGDLTITRMDSAYNLPSSLNTLAGHWELIEEDVTTFLDVNASGNFSGGNSAGCRFSGKIDLIDARKNLYDVKSFTISQCGAPWDGLYQGLAAVVDEDLVLTLVKQDGSFGFFVNFSR